MLSGWSDIGLASLAMLGSAIAHAFMTLLTKKAQDKLVFRGLSIGIVGLLFLPWLVLQPWPSWEVWRFLLAGAVVVWAFNMLLIEAFKAGEMNLAYPVMRGAAPALAALSAFVFLNESLSILQLAGLGLASLALLGFAWPEQGGAPKARVLILAFLAASLTATYTVIDASGVRAADSVLIYAGWFFVLSGSLVFLTAVLRRGRAILPRLQQEFRPALTSMSFNFLTYSLALFAYSRAPVAPMSALRETSIIFGAILSTILLKEAFGKRRIALAILLTAGLVLIQVSMTE